MLVLSRKKNESIIINDNITIVVVEIRGDKVRLGIEAPKNVSVHRKEIYGAIQASNAEKQDRGEPVTKIIDGIETTFVDQDDDWDSTEHDSHDTMINEGCPNTDRKGAA